MEIQKENIQKQANELKVKIDSTQKKLDSANKEFDSLRKKYHLDSTKFSMDSTIKKINQWPIAGNKSKKNCSGDFPVCISSDGNSRKVLLEFLEIGNVVLREFQVIRAYAITPSASFKQIRLNFIYDNIEASLHVVFEFILFACVDSSREFLEMDKSILEVFKVVDQPMFWMSEAVQLFHERVVNRQFRMQHIEDRLREISLAEIFRTENRIELID